MSNINFDNPLLLFSIIPMIIVVIIPFIIVVRKGNIKPRYIISLILHFVICTLITLVIAVTTLEIVITETNIYVLADVSYSSNENLHLIDEYIDDLGDTIPKNSKIGVVAFGNDYMVLNKPGEKIRSVKEALDPELVDEPIDQSGTDIAAALEYTGTLFTDDVIKRIVIISDGKETNKSNIVGVVEKLTKDDIYIDAIYLDNNIKEESNEIQINQIEYTKSTYLNREEKVIALVQSSVEANAVMTLQNGENSKQIAITLNEGFNVINVDLDTKTAGEKDYILSIQSANETHDTSPYNNAYQFTQKVAEKVEMLFVSQNKAEEAKIKELYGEVANIDIRINKAIPYTIDELVKYDIFVLSNVDVRELDYATEFLKNVDICVSQYGKSLVTMGNTYIQNNENDDLSSLSTLLPTNYGNDDQNNRALGIVIDVSRSMQTLERIHMAKQAACATVDLLNEEDMVFVIGFAGSIKMLHSPVYATDEFKVAIKEAIMSAEPSQGTFMGSSLNEAYKILNTMNFKNKDIMLFSDGKPYGGEATDAEFMAGTIGKANISISTVNTGCDDAAAVKLMEKVASIANGKSYFIEELADVDKLILNEVANDIKDSIIQGGSYEVNIDRTSDDLVDGIKELPNISGYYFNSIKTSAKVVLSTKYVTDEETEYNVPIYSYWNYGDGKVASLASDISNNWLDSWTIGTTGREVLDNIIEVNTPKVRLSAPFILTTETSGTKTSINVVMNEVNFGATLSVSITTPSAEVIDKQLAFSTDSYITNFDTEESGKYLLTFTYNWGNYQLVVKDEINISYLSEYDSFTTYEASNLYYMVNNNGQVSEDGVLKLENDNSFIKTHTYNFTPLFMVICVVLFIFDIIVRKIRMQDIISLFKKKKKEVK